MIWRGCGEKILEKNHGRRDFFCYRLDSIKTRVPSGFPAPVIWQRLHRNYGLCGGKHVWLKKQLDKTADEVVREHRRINYDTPTNEMTLIFYRSMKDFDNGIGWKQYTYRVDGNEVELIAEDSWP